MDQCTESNYESLMPKVVSFQTILFRKTIIKRNNLVMSFWYEIFFPRHFQQNNFAVIFWGKKIRN